MRWYKRSQWNHNNQFPTWSFLRHPIFTLVPLVRSPHLLSGMPGLIIPRLYLASVPQESDELRLSTGKQSKESIWWLRKLQEPTSFLTSSHQKKEEYSLQQVSCYLKISWLYVLISVFLSFLLKDLGLNFVDLFYWSLEGLTFIPDKMCRCKLLPRLRFHVPNPPKTVDPDFFWHSPRLCQRQ